MKKPLLTLVPWHTLLPENERTENEIRNKIIEESSGGRMGFIGGVAKAILITAVFFWVLAILWYAVTGQAVMALLFLVGLSIPVSFIAYEYWKNRKR